METYLLGAPRRCEATTYHRCSELREKKKKKDRNDLVPPPIEISRNTLILDGISRYDLQIWKSCDFSLSFRSGEERDFLIPFLCLALRSSVLSDQDVKMELSLFFLFSLGEHFLFLRP